MGAPMNSGASLGSRANLDSFGSGLNVAVIGASGGIGGALCDALASSSRVERLFRFSRSSSGSGDNRSQHIDLLEEPTIAEAAAVLKSEAGVLDIVIVATGVLHDGTGLAPEKTWRSLSAASLERAFRINATGPALVAKHLLPLLRTDRKSAFAALSARVGSISDNSLGGWYAYRSSKAALNMLIKTLSIELGRRNPNALCIGLHPGTVDTSLSKPFQRSVSPDGLFSPEASALHLLDVLNTLEPRHTGGQFAWDGSPIPS